MTTTESIAGGVRRASKWLIALGVVMMVLGIAAIVEPFVASIAVARVISWTFWLAGVVRTIHAIQSRYQKGFWLRLIIGVLYLVVGILLLNNVLEAKYTLTFILGWSLVAQGILEAIIAFRIRPEPNWGVMLSSGIISSILGVLIVYRWPSNAAWLLGFFTGVSFFCTGAWMIALPWQIRSRVSRELDNSSVDRIS